MANKKTYATIDLAGIKLDVTYWFDDSDGYVHLEEITDTRGEQDLMPIMAQAWFDDVIQLIKKLERV